MSREIIRILKKKINQIKKSKGLGKRRIIVLQPGEEVPSHDDSVTIIRVVYKDARHEG